MMVVFSQYLKNISLPFPVYTPKGGFRIVKAPVFKLFPVRKGFCKSQALLPAISPPPIFQVLITILFMWSLCAILTATDAVGPESAVRTDLKLSVIQKSAWFRFPYPCKIIFQQYLLVLVY